MRLWLIGALMVAVASTLPLDVEAKRMGGGKSTGMQRDMPARTSPDAAPGKPATPAQAAPGTPAAAGAAAAAPKRNWMGPLAGLAAGLGIAALLSHLGMGEGMANILMMVLLAAAAFFVIRFLMRRFAGGGTGMGQPALAGAVAGTGQASPTWPRSVDAQPLQRNAVAQEPAFEPAVSAPASGSATGASLAPAAAAGVTRAFVPAAFDSESFARTAKMIFIRLQTAHDTADLDDLRRFTTPELFASLRLDIQERGTTVQHTDVAKVEAEVLDVVDEADRQIVSVRFHGDVVEEKGAAATTFNEVWHLVKPHDDSRAWAIAGIEQLN